MKALQWQQEKELGDPHVRRHGHLRSGIMLRQLVLKYSDPDVSQSVDQVRWELHSVSDEYYHVVVKDKILKGLDKLNALRIYHSFYWITPAPAWGEIQAKCTCRRALIVTNIIHASTLVSSFLCMVLTFLCQIL